MREHDARGDGGGFAALEAFCRRVAGVSRLYWCNSPASCLGMKGVAHKLQASPPPPPGTQATSTQAQWGVLHH